MSFILKCLLFSFIIKTVYSSFGKYVFNIFILANVII